MNIRIYYGAVRRTLKEKRSVLSNGLTFSSLFGGVRFRFNRLMDCRSGVWVFPLYYILDEGGVALSRELRAASSRNSRAMLIHECITNSVACSNTFKKM
jgi:hypothetical protein